MNIHTGQGSLLVLVEDRSEILPPSRLRQVEPVNPCSIGKEDSADRQLWIQLPHRAKVVLDAVWSSWTSSGGQDSSVEETTNHKIIKAAKVIDSMSVWLELLSDEARNISDSARDQNQEQAVHGVGPYPSAAFIRERASSTSQGTASFLGRSAKRSTPIGSSTWTAHRR